MIKLFSLILLTHLCFCARSQVVINLQLPPSGLTVKEQLWNLSLVNSSGSQLAVQIEMQLSDAATNQRVLTAVSRVIDLPAGIRQIRNSDLSPLTYNVLNPSYPVDANQAGFLPIGTFNVCYTVRSQSNHGEYLSDECETVQVEPLSPPSLVLPADYEEVETSRPQFTWLPPAPAQLFNRLTYDLVLVEVLKTQTPADAVANNVPKLLLNGVLFTSAQYPLGLVELDTSKTYAWRVRANNDGLHIANSETWTFKIARSTTQDLALKKSDYIKSSRNQDAAFGVVRGNLQFQYDHALNDSLVRIELFDISSSNATTVDIDQQTLNVKYGSNFSFIDLESLRSLASGRMYLLVITNSNQQKSYLKFKYDRK